MHMNGRFETRLFVTVPLYLLDPKHSDLVDLALTENVSPCGVRIVSKRCAEPGGAWELRSLSGGLQISVRVIYCEKVRRHSFRIGLRLLDPVQQWWNGGSEIIRQPDRAHFTGTRYVNHARQATRYTDPNSGRSVRHDQITGL